MIDSHVIRAVAFDAYGTLVEITDKRRPYERVARARTINPLVSPITQELDLIAFADRCGLVLNAQWQSDLAAELKSIRPFEEGRDVLTALHRAGYRVAVASNLALPYETPIRACYGDLLDVACLSFEIGAAKPDAPFYRALCRQLDCEPQEILMVGDSWRSDYQGATRAGLQALHLDRRGVGPAGREAITITDLRRLLAILPA
ncbi:HAD family hydrolase [Labrys neptuniae]|uniref:HAD family hydrolase n=1 Tax=Labrys neptuniae TaxID=376174 RepID=A0ABV3PIY7_9HYPH|nr:HAD family hydrolase [Labrys neptuniae]MDT3376812.1 HAD family hydrolase [Labrys neptuniae]